MTTGYFLFFFMRNRWFFNRRFFNLGKAAISEKTKNRPLGA